MPQITVNSSAFSSTSLQSNVAENEAQWQVATNAAFANPLYDTWFQDTDLTSYTFDVTSTVHKVWVRVRYRDNYGEVGAWGSLVLSTPKARAKVITGAHIVLPEPRDLYQRENEAQFRKTVERAFSDTQQLILQQGRVRGYQDWKQLLTLADDAEQQLPLSSLQRAGWVRVSCFDDTNVEGGLWVFGGNGGNCVVQLVAGTTNTAATDSDTDLCVYTDGSDVYVKNRLGASVDMLIAVEWR